MRDEGRNAWRDEGRDGGCAVFVSSSWRFIGRWRRRGWMRAGGVPWAWWWWRCHPHVSSFFLPLVSDEAGGVATSPPSRSPFRFSVSFLCLVLASRLFRLGVRLVGASRYDFSSWGGIDAFRFLSLRFARGHDRWLVSIRLSRVSLRPSARLIRPVFFIVIGAGSEERGGDVDDAPFYPARFLLFAVSALMPARVIASMTRMREGETIGNGNGENETKGWGKTE